MILIYFEWNIIIRGIIRIHICEYEIKYTWMFYVSLM
jgi:hypothetical protein